MVMNILTRTGFVLTRRMPHMLVRTQLVSKDKTNMFGAPVSVRRCHVRRTIQNMFIEHKYLVNPIIRAQFLYHRSLYKGGASFIWKMFGIYIILSVRLRWRLLKLSYWIRLVMPYFSTSSAYPVSRNYLASVHPFPVQILIMSWYRYVSRKILFIRSPSGNGFHALFHYPLLRDYGMSLWGRLLQIRLI